MNDGFLNVLKPPGMTSHEVVNCARRIFSIQKIGHLGTLDPGAAGVLPLAIGNATRLIEYVERDSKGYRAEMTFGITTDTFDAHGKILSRAEVSSVDFGRLESILSLFHGTIIQRPPPVSSIRHQGKHLYEYYREGIEVEAPLREVRIESIRIVELRPPVLIADVECGEGTYIRSLCRDIGDALGCGAHLSFLVRFRSGVFTISDSITLEELTDRKQRLEHLSCILPPSSVLKNLTCIRADEHQTMLVSRGIRINPKNPPPLKDNETVLVETNTKEVIAIGRVILKEGVSIQPVKVFVR